MRNLAKIILVVLILISGLLFASKVAQEEKKQQIINAVNNLGVTQVTAYNCVFSFGGSLLDVYQKSQDCYLIFTFAISKDGEVKYIGKVKRFNILRKK